MDKERAFEATKKKKTRGGGTVLLNWEEWVEYCAEQGIDPREFCEDGRDLGGGNSLDFVCYEDPPEEEE